MKVKILQYQQRACILWTTPWPVVRQLASANTHESHVIEVTFPVSPQQARSCQISAPTINITFGHHTTTDSAFKHQFSECFNKM